MVRSHPTRHRVYLVDVMETFVDHVRDFYQVEHYLRDMKRTLQLNINAKSLMDIMRIV